MDAMTAIYENKIDLDHDFVTIQITYKDRLDEEGMLEIELCSNDKAAELTKIWNAAAEHHDADVNSIMCMQVVWTEDRT